MSKYTTELRYICENSIGLDKSKGYKKINEILEECWNKIFDFDFPIFDENYKSILCIKILRHYYTREISEETVGLWKLRLEAKMNEIMPFFNRMYETIEDDINIFFDTNITTEHELSRNDNSTASSNVTNYSLYSDTPQGALEGIESGEYLTTANKDVGNSDTSQTLNTTDEYLEKKIGKNGGENYAQIFQKFKNKIVDVDLYVIDSLEPLFFKLW